MAAHITEVRVRYGDTDQGGVVYHGRYLDYFEVGRTEMLREKGVPYASIEAEGFALPVIEAHLSYRASARYDDLLLVESELTDLRRVQLRIDTKLREKDSGRLLAEGWIRLACVNRTGQVVALPDRLRSVLDSGKKSST